MAEVKNIIVGAAAFYISKVDGDAREVNPSFGDATKSATDSANSTSDLRAAASKFTDLGYTSEGVELSYEPDYGEVTVDQLLDAARLFKQGLRINLRTSLVEGTLENMNLAFGQKTSAVSSVVNNNSQVLNFEAGALGDRPSERTVVFVGQGPTGVTGHAANIERVYVARRVVSVETVAHALRRTEATMFPVNLRCLPVSDSAYKGSEYGKVIDRSWA